MHYLDFVFILIFTILVLITGSAFAKAGGKDMKSFFAAGGLGIDCLQSGSGCFEYSMDHGIGGYYSWFFYSPPVA